MKAYTRLSLLSHVAILGSIALLVTAGCGSQQTLIPTSYSNYSSKDGTFACEYPEGWEAKGGGKQGPVWAKFSSGSALIHFKATVSGSLMNDAMGGRGVEGGLPPQLEPVHRIHLRYLKTAEEDFNDYTEAAGSPLVFDCQLGPARVSEFTASSSFGSAIHGYRATIIGFNKGVTLYCTCPESEWLKVKPAFNHVLSTLKRGESED